jgi:hypothetical protein
MVVAERERVRQPERPIQINVRFTAEEHRSLERLARERDLRLGQAIRHLIREASTEAHGGEAA